MKLNSKSLAEVELGLPVLAEAILHARICGVEVKPNKTGDGNNLILTYQITDPVVVKKDGSEIINKGHLKYTRHYSLKPTASYDPDQRMKELAVAIGLPPEQDLNTEDLEGKDVMVSMTIREAEGSYGERNEVGRTTRQPEDDLFSAGPLG